MEAFITEFHRPPIEFSKEDEEWINNYVNEASKIFFGTPYKPKAPLIPEDLDYTIGGYTQFQCSPKGCYPRKIVLNRKLQEERKFAEYSIAIHEKTHEAMTQAYPYLPIILDEDLIEGIVIYATIEKALIDGNYDLALIIYNSLSPEYREYYHIFKKLNRELEKEGIPINQWLRYLNEYAKKIIGKYN